MKKLLAALSCAAMVAIPTAANAMDAGVTVQGKYGHPLCYYEADYFRIDAGIQSTPPFVDTDTEGSVGGEVHCPIF